MKAPATAFWIGSAHPFDLHEVYLNFRADLTLTAVPRAAWLHLTADSRYRLWVNGSFVGRGPERSWPQAMAVDRIELGPHLRAGVNRLAVQVYSPGYSHFAHVDRAACGLIAWIEADGNVLMTTDRSWRVKRDPSWAAEVPRVSIYGTGVELRDMNRAEDWQQTDAGGWPQARIVQPAEGPVWAGLRTRTTPLLQEERRGLDQPWQTRFGPTPETCGDPHRDLGAALDVLDQAAIPASLAPGQTAIWIFDLGQSLVALAGAEITGHGGEVLTLSYAEKLRDGRLLISDPDNYCRMRPTDRSILRPGRQTIEGFTPRGGRYLIFRLDAVAGPVTPQAEVFVRLPRYPLAAGPLPDLGDSGLNAVARMCQRTVLACLQDGFVDSVWRESSQWLGDVVAQAFALQAISADPRPLRLAIDLAAEGAAADGILPSVLPGEAPAYVVTDYNFSWVELLAAYAAHPGVRDADMVLARHWPRLEAMLARFEADRGADGLIRSQPGRRLFLDWSAMDRGEPNLTYNLRYLHALRLAAGLARRRGLTEPWSDLALDLALAIRRTHLRIDGWLEAPGGAAASQLAMALLILTDMVSDDEARRLADRIVAASLEPEAQVRAGPMTLASPFMHHYVFQALDHLGRGADITRIIAALWGRWAAAGEATTWENWDIAFPDGSACHGFSAHPLGWLLR